MSASYTPLNQGQGDDPKNQPNNVNLSIAPMAKAEHDDMMDDHHKTDETPGNVPHVLVTEPTPHDEKSNPMGENHFMRDDDIDGPLKEDDRSLHFGDLRPNTPHSSIGRIPHLGLNFDTELGSIAGETIPDINVYQHKKTLAQGMMDLALFSANANQLRYVLDSYSRHPYYWPSVICIVLSLTLQVAIGIGLIWNALYDVKDKKEICIANKINNWCVIGIFLVVVVNVFVSSFGVSDPLQIPIAPLQIPPPPVVPVPVPTPPPIGLL